jgi:hypothetical protein
MQTSVQRTKKKVSFNDILPARIFLSSWFYKEMTTLAALIWAWSLVMLPFTSILTFILTLIICNMVPNNAPKDEKFPQISQLGTGEAHIYFVIGFVVLLPQLLLVLVGRLQFLFQTQLIINRILLCIIHVIALISSIFMLIMATVSVDDNPSVHLTGAYGMFGCISLYCFLHTILIFYLFIRRSNAPQHSTVIYPIWFLVCCLLLIIFFIVWLTTATGIPEYIAAASPFLYFLGFVPQFWSRARAKRRDSIFPGMVQFSNEPDA